MPVERGEPVHFGGRTLPSASGPTPSLRHPGRAPHTSAGSNSIDLHLGGALHRLGQLLNSNNAGLNGPADSVHYPGVTSQLRSLTGYDTLRHPIRAIQHERAKAPMAKANDAALLHLFSPFSASKVAARGAAKGLDTRFAAFQGDLSGERFVHGAPVPIPFGIKGFSYRARNPEAQLGSGVYTNNIPSRPDQFAQMSPSSRKNNAPWMQARFSDEATANAFAARQKNLGREVKTQMQDAGGGRNLEMYSRRVLSLPKEGYLTDAGRSVAVTGHKAQIRLGMQPPSERFKLGRQSEHYLVEHRAGGAPSMLPLGVKPGTRLFDLNAPIEPGEAARAKELLIQKLKLGRAAIGRDWQDDGAGFGGKEDVKRWSSQLLPENAQAFDDLERLAKLRAAGRNKPFPDAEESMHYRQRSRPIPQSQMDDQLIAAPTGKHLHRLLDSITRGVHQPSATAYLDKVPRDQQHILDNPNSVLRQMGYHGLIDPTFPVGGETGKEIVMFDKNRLEPFHNTRQRVDPYVRQPYPVKMAKSLSGVGANFIGAVKQVRSGLMPHMDLPLSDEVNLSIVNLGDGKVRFFVRSAKHPDSVGQELNGAQALHLAHRSLVERKGGHLTGADVGRALHGITAPGETHARIEYDKNPVGGATMSRLLRQQNPELDKRLDRIHVASDPALSSEIAARSQRRAARNEKATQAAAKQAAHVRLAVTHPAGTYPIGPEEKLLLRDIQGAGRQFWKIKGAEWGGKSAYPISVHSAGELLVKHGHAKLPVDAASERKPPSMQQLADFLKARGRQVEESPSKRIDQLRHTMNGVSVPNERYLNFDRNESGVPLEALPEPPRAREFFGSGSLVSYLHGATDAEKKQLLANLDEQLAERWHVVRSAHNAAPQAYFPRFPMRKGYPSFGGVAPAEPGGRGRPPYQLGANMEPLQSALNRANKLGLQGAERRAYVKAYLERRRKG